VFLNIQRLEIWCRYDVESEELQVAVRVKSAYNLSLATVPFVLIVSIFSKQGPAPREVEERFEVSDCRVVAFGQNREVREASSCTDFEYCADDR
jgi:hypothetical protein